MSRGDLLKSGGSRFDLQPPRAVARHADDAIPSVDKPSTRRQGQDQRLRRDLDPGCYPPAYMEGSGLDSRVGKLDPHIRIDREGLCGVRHNLHSSEQNLVVLAVVVFLRKPADRHWFGVGAPHVRHGLRWLIAVEDLHNLLGFLADQQPAKWTAVG